MAIGAVSLSIAACSTNVGQRVPAIAYVPDPNGIQLLDSPLRIDFGRTETSTITAMKKLEGVAPSLIGNCGGEVTFSAWSRGLILYFEDGDFVRWATGFQDQQDPCERIAQVSG